MLVHGVPLLDVEVHMCYVLSLQPGLVYDMWK